MYHGGTTIGITPSPLSAADVQHQALPADSRLRALMRALQGGTSEEAAQLHKDLLAPRNLRDLLDRKNGDPWGAILAGLLFIRFPDVLGELSPDWVGELVEKAAWAYDRSEEHTSELQSLMRISYAVFCLKKKKNK